MSQGKSFSERITDQDRLLRPNGPPDRVQHQKMILGAFGTLEISDNLPIDAKHEPFVSGKRIAACRFSNGQPKTFNDHAPDVRGIAVKFFLEDKEIDLFVTNEGGRSHARNAAEFLDVSDILAAEAARGIPGVIEEAVKKLESGAIGLLEAARVGTVLAEETIFRHVKSLTTEAYWGSVVELGGKPIQYSLQPHPSTRPGTDADPNDPNFLHEDLLNRLKKGPIRFNLCIQFFRDKDTTPVDDASVKWDATLVKIGELEIVSPPSSDKEEAKINQMAFNPGNGFVPRGITKDRQEIYAAGAHNRGALSSDEVRNLFRQKS